MIEKEEGDIRAEIDRCDDSEHGSQFPGMTYEQGARNALEWVLGDIDAAPMDE
jgi:hypothetical protein